MAPSVGRTKAVQIERDQDGMIASEMVTLGVISTLTCRRLLARVQAVTGSGR